MICPTALVGVLREVLRILCGEVLKNVIPAKPSATNATRNKNRALYVLIFISERSASTGQK